MKPAFVLALLLLVALPLRAETYKWVDDKGVTNYSSTPPATRAAKVIEERVSVIPADPSLASAIADMRAQAAKRAEYVELEWLQRQRLMAAQPAPAVIADDSHAYAYSPAYYPTYPVFVGRPVRGFRPVSAPGPVRPVRPSQRPSGGRR